jgi:hypothetical protein
MPVAEVRTLCMSMGADALGVACRSTRGTAQPQVDLYPIAWKQLGPALCYKSARNLITRPDAKLT